MRVCLVTGGAGFIGSHIAECLVQRGDRVRVLDNLSTGVRENMASFAAKIEFIEGDLVDAAAVAEAVRGVDCVFHQAALASVPLSVDRPLDTNAACVTGTLNLLDQARRAGVRRLVFAASSAAYGDAPHASKRESDLPVPLSPYAAAKLAGEYYCRAFFHTYGLETVCLRYFNVFGPRQDPKSPYSAVIPLFITAMLAGRQPIIYGDGLQSRDFTYVEDVVHGNLLAADAKGVAGRTLNIATGRSTNVLELIQSLNRMFGLDVAPVHAAPRPGEVRESTADITLARSLLGYAPRVDFEEGLRRLNGHTVAPDSSSMSRRLAGWPRCRSRHGRRPPNMMRIARKEKHRRDGARQCGHRQEHGRIGGESSQSGEMQNPAHERSSYQAAKIEHGQHQGRGQSAIAFREARAAAGDYGWKQQRVGHACHGAGNRELPRPVHHEIEQDAGAHEAHPHQDPRTIAVAEEQAARQ